MTDEQQVQCDDGSIPLSVLESGKWSHQRESLLGAIQNLEHAALKATDVGERNSYAIAAIVCAHCAAEAFLNEWAKIHAPSTYEDTSGRRASLLMVAEEVLPELGASLSVDLIELVNMKNALCHPELSPAGSEIDPDLYPSAKRATSVARLIHAQCFPATTAMDEMSLTI